jgi:hypothetical protein
MRGIPAPVDATRLRLSYDKHLDVVELSGGISRAAPISESHTWISSLAGLALLGWAVQRRRSQRE